MALFFTRGNQNLTVLRLQGVDLTDEELLSYISESSTMSKSVDEYEGAPSSKDPTID